MPKYQFLNIDTQHVFFESDQLEAAIDFYHRVPRRKATTLAIMDTETGELLKIKLSKEAIG